VKAPQCFTEDRPGEKPPLGGLTRCQHFEGCRSCDEAQRKQSAGPYDKRQQSGVPQREHPVIIITTS
jgi:hypothetical protein